MAEIDKDNYPEPLTGENIIRGGKRCHIAESLESKGYWYSRGKSERVDLAEGDWEDWVELAKQILAIEAQHSTIEESKD